MGQRIGVILPQFFSTYIKKLWKIFLFYMSAVRWVWDM